MSEQIDYYKLKRRVRDSQVSKVYKWGHKIKEELPKINKFQIKELVKLASLSMETLPPEVDLSNQRKVVACYRPTSHTVCFPNEDESWAHNMEVVLHEVSHAIHHELMRKLKHKSWIQWEESHGPGFVAINIFLLDQFTELTTRDLTNHAWDMGVRVGSIFNYMEESDE